MGNKADCPKVSHRVVWSNILYFFFLLRVASYRYHPSPREHFQLIAGYVVIKTEDKRTEDECGNEVVKRVIQQDFDSYSYDILKATVTKDGKQYYEIRLIPRGGSSQTWANANDTKQNGYGSTVYSDLGPIKAGLTHDSLQQRGLELAKGMGQYSFWTNDCNTFVKKFYDQIKG